MILSSVWLGLMFEYSDLVYGSVGVGLASILINKNFQTMKCIRTIIKMLKIGVLWELWLDFALDRNPDTQLPKY